MKQTVYSAFTDEQIKQFGPMKNGLDTIQTERHVYTTPLMYANVTVGNFVDIDPERGVGLQADEGFVTIKEDKPIVAVIVVGSGSAPKGYNLLEWWGEGESISDMKTQLVKRQRVGNLEGMHPTEAVQLLMGAFPGKKFADLQTPEDVKSAVDWLKKMSDGYYESLPLMFHENTVYFRVGPPYPNKITVRCGCEQTQPMGLGEDRRRSPYAIRVVETLVIK